jgi:ribosomal protein S18 acetylase RimI-like enzyme
MELDEFIALHGPALEMNAARHNLILGLLERAKGVPDHGFMLWSFDEPGACAIRTTRVGRGVLLGDVNEAQARSLARMTIDIDYPNVQGPDDTAKWFAAEAETLGPRFRTPEPLRISALSRPPSRPNVPGAARGVTPEDALLLMDWTVAFARDAGIPDPPPSLEEMNGAIARGRHFLWIVEGQPVAMAALGRQMRGCGSIAPVYTLPEWRGRGFGGAITAHVVDQIFAAGRQTACLYIDANNPASNRCYAKLGFEPVCDCWVIRRAKD